MRLALSFAVIGLACTPALADLGTGFDREPPTTDPKQQLDDCIYTASLSGRIEACSGAIASGKFGKIDLSIAYNNRGIALGKLRRHEAALSDFEQAIDLDPEYADAFHNRAVEFARTGALSKSVKDLSRAIDLKPRAAFYRTRGVIYEEQSNFDQAIADYSKAADMDPKDFASRNSLAWLLATAPNEKLREGQRALKTAREAIELYDSPSHRDTLAAAYAEAGAFSKAVAEQELAIDMLRDQGAQAGVKDFEQRLNLYRNQQPFRQD